MESRDKKRTESQVSSLIEFVEQAKRNKYYVYPYDSAVRALIRDLLEEKEDNSDLIVGVVEVLEFEKNMVFEYMVEDVISRCIRKLPESVQKKLSNVILQQGSSGFSWGRQMVALDFANNFYDLCDPVLLQNLLHQLAYDTDWEVQRKVAGIIGKVFSVLPNKKQAYYDLRMLSEHPRREVKFAAKGALGLIDSVGQGVEMRRDPTQRVNQEATMDITPFIPIILEATRFIFDEVSKWIAEIRQKAAQESAPPVESTLPVTREQLMAAELDPESIASLLNQAATQADVAEIRNLLDQLKTRRALFLELESQEVTAAGAEAAKLRVEMQNVARDIIKTTERLESALSRVYRSR